MRIGASWAALPMAAMVVMGGLVACADSPVGVGNASPPAPVPLTVPPAVAAQKAAPAPPVASAAPAMPPPVRTPPVVTARPPAAAQPEPVRTKATPRRSGPKTVACTTQRQGQGSYETADIVCKNGTDAIHTVYLDIRAPGYAGLPSHAATQGGYLLAPGESKRVVPLKVVSRPATLAVNTRVVPFKALMPPV